MTERLWKLLILSLFVTINLNAQSKQLAKARGFISAQQYDKALRILEDELAQKPKGGGEWFSYAQVQYALFQEKTDMTAKYTALVNSVLGYENARLYLDETSTAFAVANRELSEMQPPFLNEGMQSFNKREYSAATEQFLYAHAALKSDTVALIFGINAANQAGLYQQAFFFNEKLNAIKPREKYYQNMFFLQKDRLKDINKAMLILKEAQANFPNNYSFQKYEVDLLISLNKNQEALNLIDQLILVNPKNLALILNKALLTDKAFKKAKNQLDSADQFRQIETLIQLYQEVLALSPKNPLANFNLAVVYSEQSNFYVKEINRMGANMSIEQREISQKASEAALIEAVKYMEAAKESQPTNMNILNALRLFYDKLGLSKKRDALDLEIQALKN